MKKVGMYHHASGENHGCEAIIRTVSGIIEKGHPGSKYTVTSKYPDYDRELIDTEGKDFNFIELDRFNNVSFEKRTLLLGAPSQLFHAVPLAGWVFKALFKAAKEADVCISVGGDNYSYGKSAALTTIDRYVRKRCKNSILWGCSINPDMLEGKEFAYKVRGLRDFSLILAR